MSERIPALPRPITFLIAAAVGWQMAMALGQTVSSDHYCCDGAILKIENLLATQERRHVCLKEVNGQSKRHGREVIFNKKGERVAVRHYYLDNLVPENMEFNLCQGLPTGMVPQVENKQSPGTGFIIVGLGVPLPIELQPTPRPAANGQIQDIPPVPQRKRKSTPNCPVFFNENGEISRFNINDKKSSISKEENERYLKEAIKRYHPELLKSGEMGQLTAFDKRNLICSHYMHNSRPWFDLSFGAYKGGVYRDVESYLRSEGENTSGDNQWPQGRPPGRGLGRGSDPANGEADARAGSGREGAPGRTQPAPSPQECQGKTHNEARVYASIFPDKIDCGKSGTHITEIYKVEMRSIKDRYLALIAKYPCHKKQLENDQNLEEAKVVLVTMKACFLENKLPGSMSGVVLYDELNNKVKGLWNSDYDSELEKKYLMYKNFSKNLKKLGELAQDKGVARTELRMILAKERADKKARPSP